ncbi:hypothetical protein SASPL_120928 [Salvia splendens]|uniref:Myosin motor domain-containing protein n=1 Tax=Salvia splendens TaxID=180675 RepID=A0A8X8ZWQ7_SALSN|nr:hypothetical protein SASPL_120928 [Salvia splendens]
MGTPPKVYEGSHICVEDLEVVWINGKVLKILGEKVESKHLMEGRMVSRTIVTASISKTYPKDEEDHAEGFDDMNELDKGILIAVNPFQRLPDLYDVKMMERYNGAPFGELSPRVFAIGEAAFRSGAGKTETTKMLMQYLTYLGGHKEGEGRSVELQVLEAVKGVSGNEVYCLPGKVYNFKMCARGDKPLLHHLPVYASSKANDVDDAHDYYLFGNKESHECCWNWSRRAGFNLQNCRINSPSWCDSKALEDALLKRVMVTPEEVINRCPDPDGAIVSRDGLAKTIYSRLFNCFEQFCINFTNKKVQQHFNQHVFKMEQEEYIKEEIAWSYIDYVDNQGVLDLIEKKPGGIVALLDVACMFPKSTHEIFAEKLYQTFKPNKHFIKPKLSRTELAIAHYAGEVQYQCDQFLDKNKGYVVPEHQVLLTASQCPFLVELFPPIPEETTKSSNKSSKFSSIGSRFKGVLEAIRISLSGYPTHKTFDEYFNGFLFWSQNWKESKSFSSYSYDLM